jgi:hypothetical protein
MSHIPGATSAFVKCDGQVVGLVVADPLARGLGRAANQGPANLARPVVLPCVEDCDVPLTSRAGF